MCELLAMSANVPTDIVFSFTGLIQRGGRTGPHKDGWGIAFYQGRGLRLLQDPAPGCESEIAKLVQHYPIKSQTIIAHVRQANVGAVSLENTHPFVRELWGRLWCLAHNGQLPGFSGSQEVFQPVGDTDSEALFCDLLNRLRRHFAQPVSLEQALPVILKACREYLAQGVCNLLLSDGHCLFSLCSSKLAWITRRAPFGPAHLSDTDLTVDFCAQTNAHDVVTVLATEPLTDNEIWQGFEPGQWRLWRQGECIEKGQLS